ncbi:MAG: hypothetical protein ACK4S4_00740 [Pyrinomonadaceae bacterium]
MLRGNAAASQRERDEPPRLVDDEPPRPDFAPPRDDFAPELFAPALDFADDLLGEDFFADEPERAFDDDDLLAAFFVERDDFEEPRPVVLDAERDDDFEAPPREDELFVDDADLLLLPPRDEPEPALPLDFDPPLRPPDDLADDPADDLFIDEPDDFADPELFLPAPPDADLDEPALFLPADDFDADDLLAPPADLRAPPDDLLAPPADFFDPLLLEPLPELCVEPPVPPSPPLGVVVPSVAISTAVDAAPTTAPLAAPPRSSVATSVTFSTTVLRSESPPLLPDFSPPDPDEDRLREPEDLPAIVFLPNVR